MTVTSREVLPTAFFTDLQVDRSVTPPPIRPRVIVGSVLATVPALRHEVCFLLFVEDGYLTMLEGVVHGDDVWSGVVDAFELRDEPSWRAKYDEGLKAI